MEILMKTSKALILAVLLGLASPALAFDPDLGERIQQDVTGQLDQQALAKGGLKVQSEQVLAMLAKGEPITLLDIRTPAEQAVVSVTHPKAIGIPLDQLFKKENLARLTANGQIVVICHTGERAAIAASLLRAVGFRNAYFLSGGLISLVTDLTPKTAP
jgi:rhodanese-related sulfurtransferase